MEIVVATSSEKKPPDEVGGGFDLWSGRPTLSLTFTYCLTLPVKTLALAL